MGLVSNAQADVSLFLRWTSFSVVGLVTALLGCAGEFASESEQVSYKRTHAGRLKADGPVQTETRPDFDEDLCAYDIDDPFEPRSRYSKGPFEGQCHDTKIRRPVVVLSDFSDAQLRFANVFHEDGFWTAQIPPNAVENVYFQLEYFPALVPAGHTQIRMEYSEPIVLTGQSSWNLGQTRTVKNIVLSPEAVTRRGDRYNLIKGVQNNFGIALRVTSLSARYASMILNQNHHVEQWRLNLTKDEKEALLKSYVAESESLALDFSYHTLTKNCATESIRVLDTVVTYTLGEHIKRFFLKVTEFYPNIVRTALIGRGLLPLDKSTDWYPLEDDPTAEF